MATSRSSLVSLARYTSPMPPVPMGARISYGPSRVPAAKGMGLERSYPTQSSRGAGCAWFTGFHVSLCQEKKQFSWRATEERAKSNLSESAARTCASRRGFLPSQNQTSICCLRPCGPSQKIEFVFAASPETIRGEPREFDLRRSVGKMRDLAACALLILCFCFSCCPAD